ncbi:MAG TPA: pyrroloquinoline quinone biosynthesis protein PqqE [Gammaproteobacteria bacterium]|nr:pyrroloquinoline quinone biosynthesis protein PqqE [Gammaproteobacteria bacterium]
MSAQQPPLALLAELSHRCPLQCPYCSNPVDLVRRGLELGTGDWLGVVEQAAAMGILQIHYSGGEPTVRDDLERIVAHAEESGLYGNLITSGVLADRERLQRLADAGLQHVQLSVQAAEEGNADRIGGFAGGHEKKIRFAGWVREVGLPLTLNAVVHRQNMQDLPALIDLARQLGATRLEVAHVQYYGWALRNRAALMPTREQLSWATDVVEDARERLHGTLVIDYVVPDYYARRPKACMGGWGRRFLTVAPDGQVLPCHAAQSIAGLSFENVRDRPLDAIWRNSEAFERYRGVDWMPEPCRGCDRREIDWGGCRCQAFALLGDAGLTDPACEYSPFHERMRALAEDDTAGETPPFDYRRIRVRGAPPAGRPVSLRSRGS